MSRAIMVPLDPDTIERLRRKARAEDREPRMQAARMLREALATEAPPVHLRPVSER